MAINTGNFAARLTPGVKQWYGLDFEQYPVQYSKIFDIDTTSRNFEELISMAGTGIAQVKEESENMASDDISQGFVSRITPIEYAKMVTISKRLSDDDLYSPKIAQMLSKCFSQSMQHTREVVGANVLNNAFSTVNLAGGYGNPDSVALLATNHPLIKGGTLSNKLAVDTPISPASVEQLCIQIYQATSDSGIKLNLTPKKVVVPVQEAFNIQRYFDSPNSPGDANNDINTLNKMNLELIVNRYLTDTDAWFILTDAKPGLVMFNRQDIEMDEDLEFASRNFRFAAIDRFSVGYGTYLAMFGSSGT